MPTLYFGQGIPYVAVMALSVVMYKNIGISNADIALSIPLALPALGHQAAVVARGRHVRHQARLDRGPAVRGRRIARRWSPSPPTFPPSSR
jgi:hypothetical protein